MQYHNLSHGKDGYQLHVGTKSVWRTAVTRIGEKIDQATGCRWCSGLRNDWFWENSFGRRKVEEDGWVTNSINSKVLDTFNWMMNIEWRGEKELLRFHITDEQAAQFDPNFVKDMDAIF